jgi:hypothetical protein
MPTKRERDDESDEDGTIITCWCGATGIFDELFSDEPFDEPCGGTRTLYCHCGGDLCVCHHHGQAIECPGCEDCGHADDDPGFDFDPEDDYR